MGTMATYYKRKRIESGLPKTDMAKELGMNYDRYNSIEKGDVKMPSKLINKFNEIINRGSQNKLVELENNQAANDFWNEISGKFEDGQYKITKKMKEFNINSVEELSNLLGYKTPNSLYGRISGTVKASDDFKKRLYNFFQDELNIQIPHKKEIKKRAYKLVKTHDVELTKYYDTTDFRSILNDNKLRVTDVCNATNISQGVVSRLINKRVRPSDNMLIALKKYFDNLSNTINIPELVPNNIIVKEDNKSKDNMLSIVDKYKNELDDIGIELEKHHYEIKKLEIRRQVCEEVLNALDEIRNEK